MYEIQDPPDFGERLSKMHKLSYPQLWAFSLNYALGSGWLCTVQESRFTSVHTGLGDTWWTAMDKALLSMQKSMELEDV